MTSKTFSAAALAVALVAGSAQASVLWRGDFETSNLSQWDKLQMVNSNRLQVVPSPVKQGQYALRVEVRKGDDPINASGNRNELVQMTDEREGQERYYAWSTLFPSDYPLVPLWQVFMQWHHTGSSGAPPVRFVLGCAAKDCGTDKPDLMMLNVSGKNVWNQKLVRGDWHNFVLHVKWSANSNVGFVELWYDGQLVVPKTYAATMFSGQGNYLKMGLYRNEGISPTQVMFHDGLIMGTDASDVAEFMRPGSETSVPQPGTPGTPTEPTAPGQTDNGGDSLVVPNEDGISSQPQPLVPGAGCSSTGSSGGGALLALAAGAALAVLSVRRRSRHQRATVRPTP